VTPKSLATEIAISFMKSRPRRRLEEALDGIGTRALLGYLLNNSWMETFTALRTNWSAELTPCSFAARRMFFAIGEYGIAE